MKIAHSIYGTDILSVNWCRGVASLLLPHCQSGVFCTAVCRSCFKHWSQACHVVWSVRSGRRRNGRGSKVFWGNSISLQLDKASGAPIPKYIPELNLCIVVATMMSGSLVTETACAHTRIVPPTQIVSSLFIVQTGRLVVEEPLPFCTNTALVSSKHLCLVNWRTCEKKSEHTFNLKKKNKH